MPRSNYRLAVGTYLRIAMQVAVIKSIWYSLRFRGLILVGRHSNLYVARGARLTIRPGGLLALGLSPIGSHGASVELRPRSSLEIDGFVQLLRGARVIANWSASVTIGGGTYLNEGALVDCGERITIGHDCAIARNVAIMDTDSHRVVGPGKTRTRPVELADRCWLGHHATVLKGVALGHGCVVAAGAVVTHGSAPGRLLRGVPAKDVGPVEWALT